MTYKPIEQTAGISRVQELENCLSELLDVYDLGYEELYSDSVEDVWERARVLLDRANDDESDE